MCSCIDRYLFSCTNMCSALRGCERMWCDCLTPRHRFRQFEPANAVSGFVYRDATEGCKLTIMVCERADDLIVRIRDREGALRHCLRVSQRLLHGWRHGRARWTWNRVVVVGQSCQHNHECTGSCSDSIYSFAHTSRSVGASWVLCIEWRVECCEEGEN